VYPHQGERLEQARERAGAEALVATSSENVAYLTGYWSLSRAVYPATEIHAVFAPGGTALIVPSIDVASVVAAGVDVTHVACYGEFHVDAGADAEEARAVRAIVARAAASPADALAGALDALGVRAGVIGLDDALLPAASAAAAAERLRGFALRPASEALATARLVKSPYEIECLLTALRISEEAILAVLDALSPGLTERQAATLYESEIARHGAAPYCTIIAMGDNAGVPAPFPSERAARMRDVVRFDVGCIFKGYKSDVARTAIMGEPTPRQEARYDALLAGLDAAIAAVAPGVAAGAVFEAAVNATRAGGLPGYRRHHVGHGIGLAAAEPPWLSPDGSPALEPGMVLRVETPYYAPGETGMNVKDTVLVTQKGATVMNRSHRGLIVLG
jgi:Xaa-Pro dipeptidase